MAGSSQLTMPRIAQDGCIRAGLEGSLAGGAGCQHILSIGDNDDDVNFYENTPYSRVLALIYNQSMHWSCNSNDLGTQSTFSSI